jgi:hypothetical protein
MATGKSGSAMITGMLRVFALCTLFAASHPAAKPAEEDPEVRRNRLSVASQTDFGQIVSGQINGSAAAGLDGQFLQRTSVWLTQETAVRERLIRQIGVGGIFWYSLPEAKPDGEAIHKLRTKFGPGISQAQAVYKFGAIGNPSASLQMGLFPYKYNEDAQNLGEYLLRSGTYPNIIRTGGWNLLANASYMVEGLRLAVPLWGGRFRSDFILPMERDLPPNYDLSPTYVATLAPFKGLEVGGGVTWNHGISVKPSRTSPRDRGIQDDGDPGNAFLVPVPNPDTAAYGPGPYIYLRDTTRFYTFQGIKAMGRISFDPKIFLGGPGPFGPQDLKIYAEAAVLGWKNYPVLYAKRSERMPVMAGFNFPTFGFLEVLSFEVEHFGSRVPDNIAQVYTNLLPIPEFYSKFKSVDTLSHYDPDDPALSDDDWKWSLYARKRVFGGLRIHAQAASDHMRPTEYNLQPFWMPVTNRFGKDWYYLVRLEMGI